MLKQSSGLIILDGFQNEAADFIALMLIKLLVDLVDLMFKEADFAHHAQEGTNQGQPANNSEQSFRVAPFAVVTSTVTTLRTTVLSVGAFMVSTSEMSTVLLILFVEENNIRLCRSLMERLLVFLIHQVHLLLNAVLKLELVQFTFEVAVVVHFGHSKQGSQKDNAADAAHGSEILFLVFEGGLVAELETLLGSTQHKDPFEQAEQVSAIPVVLHVLFWQNEFNVLLLVLVAGARVLESALNNGLFLFFSFREVLVRKVFIVTQVILTSPALIELVLILGIHIIKTVVFPTFSFLFLIGVFHRGRTLLPFIQVSNLRSGVLTMRSTMAGWAMMSWELSKIRYSHDEWHQGASNSKQSHSAQTLGALVQSRLHLVESLLLLDQLLNQLTVLVFRADWLRWLRDWLGHNDTGDIIHV